MPIEALNLEEYIRARMPREKFIPGKSRIPLQEVMFAEEEIAEAIDSMLTTQVVMGKKVRQFEEEWCRWLGCPYAVATHSGTSALLLAMLWLKFHKATPEKREVLIPAVTWSTTLTTAFVLGLKPVLVDVDLKSLCVSTFAPALSKRTLALVPVHLMGHSANMTAVLKEARQVSALVIEDACEAVGTRWEGRKVGTFGEVGTFSFMFAHHLSTMEGGMCSLQTEGMADLFRAFRAHGWVRDSSPDFRIHFEERYPEIDRRFLFGDVGLNLRPTEIAGAFGIHQLKKADSFIEKRRWAFEQLTQGLAAYSEHLVFFEEQPGETFSPFQYPILIRETAPFDRATLLRFLEENLIETRQLAAGNLARQPFVQRYRREIEVRGSLKNADLIHSNGFVFGLNQSTDPERIDYILEVFRRFFQRW